MDSLPKDLNTTGIKRGIQNTSIGMPGVTDWLLAILLTDYATLQHTVNAKFSNNLFVSFVFQKTTINMGTYFESTVIF